MLLEKEHTQPWGLKLAAETQGSLTTSVPAHPQRGSQRTVDENRGVNRSECIIAAIRVCTPGTGSSVPCSPSCLAICPTKAALRALVGSALDMDRDICSPMLACPPFHWQFKVEMLLSDIGQKSEYFFRMRVEAENPLGDSRLSFEIIPASFCAAPVFLSALLGFSPGS